MLKEKLSAIERPLLLLLLALLLATGFYLGWHANYGGDIDSYGLLHSFYAVLNHGAYIPSRFTGYPVAEVGIGALDYWGGPGLINVACLSLTTLALLLTSLAARLNHGQCLWLLVLGLSNHVLFFESLQAMDYPLALFLLCTGWFLLSRGYGVLAVVAFAASCGARPNFIVFALGLIGCSNQHWRSRLEQSISLIVVASLFYVPVWMYSHFGFGWLSAERSDTRLLATLARFFYKSYLTLGLPVWLLLLASQHRWHPALSRTPTVVRYQAFSLIAGNALVFYFLPAEPAYLQPAILALFLLIVMTTPVLWRTGLLAANLSIWFFQIQFLHISYRNQDPCLPVAAVTAKVVAQIGEGALADFHERQTRQYCFIHKIHD